jgi:hypothetical protein
LVILRKSLNSPQLVVSIALNNEIFLLENYTGWKGLGGSPSFVCNTLEEVKGFRIWPFKKWGWSDEDIAEGEHLGCCQGWCWLQFIRLIWWWVFGSIGLEFLRTLLKRPHIFGFSLQKRINWCSAIASDKKFEEKDCKLSCTLIGLNLDYHWTLIK